MSPYVLKVLRVSLTTLIPPWYEIWTNILLHLQLWLQINRKYILTFTHEFHFSYLNILQKLASQKVTQKKGSSSYVSQKSASKQGLNKSKPKTRSSSVESLRNSSILSTSGDSDGSVEKRKKSNIKKSSSATISSKVSFLHSNVFSHSSSSFSFTWNT